MLSSCTFFLFLCFFFPQAHAGVDLSSADHNGRTALHIAAAEGRLSIVAALLAQGFSTEDDLRVVVVFVSLCPYAWYKADTIYTRVCEYPNVHILAMYPHGCAVCRSLCGCCCSVVVIE